MRSDGFPGGGVGGAGNDSTALPRGVRCARSRIRRRDRDAVPTPRRAGRSCRSRPVLGSARGSEKIQGTAVRLQRVARLTAEIMALSEAVVVLASMPTPQRTCVPSASPTSHSTYDAALASAPALIACSV